MSFLLVIWLFSTATGQLILERGPSCSDGRLVYSCTRSDGFFLTWRFQPSGARIGIRTGDSPRTVPVGSSMVLLAVLPASGASFGATVTISYSDAVGLNGTTIRCGTDTLNISVPDLRTLDLWELEINVQGKYQTGNNTKAVLCCLTYLPTSLELNKIESNIMIDPIPKSKVMGALYNVISVDNTLRSGILNGSAILMQESNVAFNLSFICVDTNVTFFIGECIFQDCNENLTYTLFPKMNWKITCFNDSNEISDIMCLSNGSWSVPILCREPIFVTTTVSPSTTSANEMTSTDIISSSTTGPDSTSETSSGSGSIGSMLYVYLVAPIVIIILALVGIIIVMAICFTKKRKKNLEDLNKIKLSEVTYQHLGNRNSNSRSAPSKRRGHVAETAMVGQEEYATLQHNLPEVVSKEEYDTINPAFATQHQQKFQQRVRQPYGTLDNKTGPTPSPDKSSYEYATSKPIVPRDDQEELPDYCTVENRDEAKLPTPDVPPNYSTPVPKSSRSKKGKSDKNKAEAAGTKGAVGTSSEDVPHTYSKTRSVPLSAQEKTTSYTDMSGGVDSCYSDIHGRNSEHDKKLDLNTLLLQLKCVREDYQKFGEAAGIDAETMKNIVDHVSTSEEGMVEVCDLWMQKCWQKTVTPSWSGVAEILTRIGRKDWAKQIVKVYTTGELPVEVDMNAVEIVENVEPAPPPLPQRSNEEEGELEEEKVAMLTVGRGKNISYEMAKTRVSKKKPAPMPSDEPPPIPAHHGDSYKSKPVPQPPQIDDAPQTNDVAAPVVPPRLTAQAPNNKLPLPAKSAPEAVSKPPRQVPKPPKAAKPQVEEPQAETPPSRPPKLSALGPKPTPKN